MRWPEGLEIYILTEFDELTGSRIDAIKNELHHTYTQFRQSVLKMTTDRF